MIRARTSRPPSSLPERLPAPSSVGAGMPRLPRTYVPRPRLFAHLDRATTNPVTLLVAPAGTGKTLGAAGWLQQRADAEDPAEYGDHRDALWIRADPSWEADRLETLLEPPRTVAPGSPDGAPDGDPDGALDGIGARPRLVVVDDAQLLPASAVQLVDARLAEAPQTLRLLLLSRWDLPLTRLAPELLGHFTVLRGGVLRLDLDEAAQLVVAHTRTSSEEVIDAVTRHAQGWCAALVLTARAVAAAPDPVAAARQYAAHDAGIADRVADEAFSSLAPRERHVLMCTAAEVEVDESVAVALTRDSGAGDVLAGLATTGLLVTRLGPEGEASTGRVEAGGRHASYRIHPLLTEVVRRRLATGDGETTRARATVSRAVRLDLARGEGERAFERLVAVNDTVGAAEVLADHGVRLALEGGGASVAAFARRHPDVVESKQETWFTIALERWLDNDVTTAARWMDRILRSRHPSGQPPSEDSLDRGTPTVACIRLMRARLGLEPLHPALREAERVVHDALRTVPSPAIGDPVMPQLLVELGTTQNWVGDLAGAEVNLTAAIGMGRAAGMAAHAAAAASHLAFTHFQAGMERACVHVAAEALALLDGTGPRRRLTAQRASVALLLAGLADLPWPTIPLDTPRELTSVHTADLCMRFWVRVRDARLALTAGSVAEAERILGPRLDLPLAAEPLPEHLQVALLVERAFLAVLSGDQHALAQFEEQLDTLGALGEASLVAGLRADLAGDRRGAVDRLASAIEEPTRAQPPTRALALTCQAQLLDALGEAEKATARLREAATATEVRRNAVPFLGWSRQGTPIQTLLTRLAEQSPVRSTSTDWVHELADAAAGRPDIAVLLAPVTPTPQERSGRAQAVVPPVLSPRERSVLRELARGATYADIAATLFVSENTVKTHVSNLYGKLGASRRSEALAVARTLRLL